METETESTGPGPLEKSGLAGPENERDTDQGIKSMHLKGEQLVITAELSGVFCQGIQYYDLKNIFFINNAGMASLIDLLQSLLRQGVDVRFVNVNEQIRKKIAELKLNHILKCC